MKSFSFAKALTLGCLMCVSLPIACGDDETTPTPNKGGSNAGGEAGGGGLTEGGAGGAAPAPMTLPPGISDKSKTEACGADMCKSASVGPVFVDPCCATDSCGLNTAFLALAGVTFKDLCQPKGQPGTLDAECTTSAASAVPFPSGDKTIMVPIDGFAGCCRANGKCGVVVDAVISPILGPLADLGLGCVDAAPFFPGTVPAACGSSGGAGGAGGGEAGGAGGAAAGASLGGAGGNQ